MMPSFSGYAKLEGSKARLRVSMPVRKVRAEVGGIELLERLAENAQQLCQEASIREPFYGLDWNEAYFRAFSPKSKLVLITVWEDKRLRAFLPLILKTGFACGLPVRKLTSCANVHSGRFDLVCCRGADREEVLRAMWGEIQKFGRWDVLDLPFVLEGSGIDELLQIAERDGFSVARKFAWRALYAEIQEQPGEEHPWLGNTKRKFRANLRRTSKQLEELGSVSFQHYTTADPTALERFFQLEASGWKGREGTAIACRPETRLFYELVAAAASRDGYFSLDFLELNGKAISAHFAMNWNGRYQVLKAAYDESYRRYGPGHLIVHELLGHLGPLGLRELDFVATATWDESCWASEYRSHFTWFVFPKTLYGSVLHFLRISVREAIKSFLHRLTRQT
jgi:CelD/BcsL family acetyltransferase involved in cellulose biosynthesis